MKLIFPIFFVLLLIFWITTQEMQAQPGCRYYSPDSLLSKYSNYYVFVGKVLEGDGNYNKVLVEENFRGMEGKKVVTVRKMDPCEGRRKVGESYLFAGLKNDDENAVFDSFGVLGEFDSYLNQRQYIELLRWKTSNQNNGIIVGKVLAQKFGNEAEKSKPDNLDKVFLQNQKGEISETLVEKDGFYKFSNLMPGEYTIFIKLPKGLSLDGEYAKDKYTYPLKSRDGFTLNFNVVYNGVISGIVLDSTNLPLKSMYVILYLIDDSGREILISSQITNEIGEYKFEKLKSAKYIVETFPAGTVLEEYGIKYPFLNENSAYPIIFYPNIRKRTQANLIKLKAGDYLANKNVILEKLKKRLIKGRVIKEDGTPAQNADILINIQRNGGENWKRCSLFYEKITKTNAKGEYLFYGYVDTKYKIYSTLIETDESTKWTDNYSSECVEIPAGMRKETPILTLDYGDNHCPEAERSVDFKMLNKNGNTFR